VSFRTLARRALLTLIAVLYAISIPWYRDSDATPEIWLGLPDWVTVAVICYVAAAVCNAVAWLLADVRDDSEAPE
jgi:negative regulator of sigma E activity